MSGVVHCCRSVWGSMLGQTPSSLSAGYDVPIAVKRCAAHTNAPHLSQGLQQPRISLLLAVLLGHTPKHINILLGDLWPGHHLPILQRSRFGLRAKCGIAQVEQHATGNALGFSNSARVPGLQLRLHLHRHRACYDRAATAERVNSGPLM